MSLTRRQKLALFLTSIVIVSVSLPVLAAVLDNAVQFNPGSSGNGVPLNVSNGPKVNVQGTVNVSLNDPSRWAPNQQTIDLVTDEGNATFTSNGPTEVSIKDVNITGAWTNVTNLDVATNELEIDPEDKNAANVSGDTDAFAFRDPTVDDGTVDFVYSGTTGSTTVTVRGVPASTNIGAVDQNNVFLDASTSDVSGKLTLQSMTNSEHKVSLQTSDGGPTIDNASMTPDDGETFETEDVTLSLDLSDPDFPADNVTVDWKVNGSTIETVTYSSGGTKTITAGGLNDADHTWSAVATDGYGQTDTSATQSFTVDHPLPTQSNPSPTGKLNSEPTELSIDINDSDFSNDGDSVDVIFNLDGSQINTQTITSNQTVTTSIPSSGLTGGQHTWTVNATHQWSNEWNNQTYKYKVPDNVTIFNVSQPTQQITPKEVTVTFFENGTKDESITKNTTTTGQIRLTGKPVSGTLVLDVEAEGYHKRTTLLESIYEQQEVYLLNNTDDANGDQRFPSVEVRFTLQDRTGDFESQNSYVKVQRPINKSGSITWKTVAGDYFGPNGFTADLRESQRYRLIVKNDNGDTRTLGTFVPTVSETVTLEIGSVTAAPGLESDKAYAWNASLNSDTNTINFEYNDTEDETTDLRLIIWQRNNRSNEIKDVTFSGPLGALSSNTVLTAEQANKTWIVYWNATRNGGEIDAQTQVGSLRNILKNLPDWMKVLVSFGALLVIAGLFRQTNGGVAAVVLAAWGGVFWYVGIMPSGVGGGVVALALILAGIFYFNRRRGGI